MNGSRQVKRKTQVPKDTKMSIGRLFIVKNLKKRVIGVFLIWKNVEQVRCHLEAWCQYVEGRDAWSRRVRTILLIVIRILRSTLLFWEDVCEQDRRKEGHYVCKNPRMVHYQISSHYHIKYFLFPVQIECGCGIKFFLKNRVYLWGKVHR